MAARFFPPNANNILPSIVEVSARARSLLTFSPPPPARVLVHPFHNSARMSMDEWKKKAPYRIHESDEHFNARYEGSCHCGRVKYQLSREKPLDAKYCHCTTCQVIHGELTHHPCRLLSVRGVLMDRQVLPSSGLPSSTRKISTSPKAITISAGMIAPKRQPSISFHVRSAAATVAHPSWTKGGT